jgi:DNA-binding CsgD family transcriptional regulator
MESEARRFGRRDEGPSNDAHSDGTAALELFPHFEIGPGTSERECLTRAVEAARLSEWPITWALEDRGEAFVVLRADLREPFVCRSGFFAANAGTIERLPADCGVASVRVLDVDASADGRRAVYFVELPSEHRREPLGPMGDQVIGGAIVPTLDMAERAGADVRPWLESRGLDRGAMIAGARVRWADVLALMESIAAQVGIAAFTAQCREFVAYIKGVQPLAASMPNAETMYRIFSCEGIEAMWGPLGPSRVLSIRPGVLVVRLRLRAGLAGCPTLIESHAGTLESLATHLNLPPARIRHMYAERDATGGTYVLEVSEPSAVGGPTKVTVPDDPGGQGHVILLEGLRTRNEARASVVERVGRALATKTDVQSIADVVMETLATALNADGVEILLSSAPGRELLPLRSRGPRDGVPAVRTMEHGGRVIGELRAWTSTTLAGDLFAALDLLTPWVSVAFGAALMLAVEHRARAAAEADQAATARVLEEVLSAHPFAAYVLSDDGSAVAANEHARRAVAADPLATLARIASAMGEPDTHGFDVLPVRIGDRTERVIVIERRGGGSFGQRLEHAAARWTLSGQQRQVLGLVARGMSNKEIASALRRAEVTVENHLTAIYRKSGADGRGQLIARLLDEGSP